jgi:type II secretory pathway pseudopilin PulG
LTVIAIIGVLAAILIPTLRLAMQKARMTTASADVNQLYQAATAYSMDFGAFPPDCTTFMLSTDVSGNTQSDIPFPGPWDNQPAPFDTPLCPNELLMWYLTRQYSTGQYNPATGSYPAAGYPDGYCSTQYPTTTGWPSSAGIVFSRGVNAGPYFDIKANQRTDYNANGFYEFVDPWGRPYMYRAYPQWATVASASAPQQVANGWTVTLTLNSLPLPTTTYPSNYSNPSATAYFSYTNTYLANTIGTIELAGFQPPSLNGTFQFAGIVGSPSQVKITFATNPNPNNINVTPGQYSFPLHNQQSCDIYSLGPYGLTRGATIPTNASGGTTEWKPTHGGSTINQPWLDPSSLDSWVQLWGTPGDGNDIDSPTANVIVNPPFRDNISNWK